MPLCSADQRQHSGAALAKMRDRMYNNVHSKFKQDQMKEDIRCSEAGPSSPIFDRLRRLNIFPALPKSSRLGSNTCMAKPPPVRSLKAAPSSGYGHPEDQKAPPQQSTCGSFLADYKPVPAMSNVHTKAHMCDNARDWASHDKLSLSKAAAAPTQICSGTPSRPGTRAASRPGTRAGMSRPGTRQSSRPGTRSASRPGTRAASRGETRGSSRPDSRSAAYADENQNEGPREEEGRLWEEAQEAQEAAKEVIKCKGFGYFNKLTHLKGLPQDSNECKQMWQHLLADKGKILFPQQHIWVHPLEARRELEAIIQNNKPIAAMTAAKRRGDE